MKEVYIVATTASEALATDAIVEAFETDDAQVVMDEDDALFSIRSETSRIDVSFETRLAPLGWTPDILSGLPELHERLREATGFYRVSIVPGQQQGSVAVFEALWTIRTLLEMVDGVVVDSTALKIHSQVDIEEITELDFDIRDHVTIHAMDVNNGQMWVHSHGMIKFGAQDVEMFGIREEDLAAAETFLHELCTDLAFGQGPAQRQIVQTSVGMTFSMLPCDEGRSALFGVDPENFDGHMSGFLTLVGAEGKHNLGDMLEQYRERFEKETEEESEALQELANKYLSVFKARFQRKGLMEPLTFVIRAPFEVHPEGEKGDTDEEQLWVQILNWDGENIVGRLVDGGHATTEWRKGAHVELEESQITAIGVNTGGRMLDPDEMARFLDAERPA